MNLSLPFLTRPLHMRQCLRCGGGDVLQNTLKPIISLLQEINLRGLLHTEYKTGFFSLPCHTAFDSGSRSHEPAMHIRGVRVER